MLQNGKAVSFSTPVQAVIKSSQIFLSCTTTLAISTVPISQQPIIIVRIVESQLVSNDSIAAVSNPSPSN
ncbi:unnamed protein product [Orchesella dallaii]|uniref:Uncharacterized protein n=1 Tax=Orchesella dallaii TaxID=48710 RepID=A0ABP1PLK8_9HEXA